MQSARSIFIFVIALTSWACSPEFPSQPSTPARPASLVIHYPLFGTRSVISSSTVFDAYTIDTDGVYARVSPQTQWSSSDSRVMTSSGSTFSFRQTGTAIVIASYQGMLATLPVDIRAATDRSSALEIQSVGSSATKPVTLFTNGSGSTVTTSVSWGSSDEHIATVNERGVVTAIAPGNVRITATLNGLSDFFWMSVAPRTK